MEEAFESGNSEKAKDCGRSAQDQLHTCESVVSALLKYLQQNSKPEPFSVCMLSELLAEFSSERICSQADPELINRDYKIRLSPFRNCLGIVIGNLDPNKDITIQGSLAGEGILQIRIFHTQDAASLKEKECWPLGILNAGGEKGIWKKGLAVARNICEQNGGRLGTGKTKAKTHFICIHWPVERVYA